MVKTADIEARGTILRAAREVLLEKGYARATMREVAGRAGVPHSLVSYHFGGKAGLCEAVVSDLFGWVADWTAAFLRGRTPDRGLLSGLCVTGVEALASHPETATSRLSRDLQDEDRLRRLVLDLTRGPFEDAVAFVERGIAAGTVRRVDPAVIVTFAVASIRAFFEDAAYYGALAGRDLTSPACRAALCDALLGFVEWITARE